MTKYNDFNSQNNQAVTITQNVLLGGAVGAAVCSALLALLSFLFVKFGTLPLHYLPIITTAVGSVGSFAGGYFSVKLHKKQGLILGALTGFLIFLIVFFTGIGKGTEYNIGNLVIKCSVMVVMGALGGIVKVNKKTKVKKYN